MASRKPFVLKKRNAPRVQIKNEIGSAKVPVKDKDIVKLFADSALFYIKDEAIKATYKGAPSILRSSDFLSALTYEIVENKRGKLSFKITISYNERWSWVCDYLNSSGKPFPMTWLTHPVLNKKQNRKRAVVSFRDKKTGEMVVRAAPLTTKQAWIHPGIAKGTWLEKGIEKGIRRAMTDVQRLIDFKIREGSLTR